MNILLAVFAQICVVLVSVSVGRWLGKQEARRNASPLPPVRPFIRHTPIGERRALESVVGPLPCGEPATPSREGLEVRLRRDLSSGVRPG